MPVELYNDRAAVTPGASWYALYTRHQHEKTVAQMLVGKGFEVFLPMYAAAHHWQDRVKKLSLPLFPGYVFLRCASERRIQARVTPGVVQFVPADRPIPIAGSEIDWLRQLNANRACARPHPFLKAGDWVRVRRGPLEGIEGVLAHWKGGYRLVLSVELLQQSAAVEIDASMVERTSRLRGVPPKHLC
jgi:transcription antitermination factor NusG